MSTVDYIVRVNQEEDGSLWAEVVELPGCFASGDTLDELRDALEEAISLYVTDDPGGGMLGAMKQVADSDRPVKPMSIGELRVRVPA
jgi:predicted RNase H-like HicB family nuclease